MSQMDATEAAGAAYVLASAGGPAIPPNGVNLRGIEAAIHAADEARGKHVEVVLYGERPEALDGHEVVATLHAYPSRGDQIAVWTGTEEAWIEVELVAWPTGGEAPKVVLRRQGGMTDEEWDNVFAAIREGRQS